MNHKTHVGLDSPTLRLSSIEAVFKLIPLASHVSSPSADVCGGARPISLAQILCKPVGAPVSEPPDSVHSETLPMLCLKPMPEATAAKTVHIQAPPMLCLKPMPETTATKILRHLYLFRSNEQHENRRVWLQLKDFHRAIFPLSKTLERFPNAFWVLPVPFDTQETAFAWQLRLECCSLFLHLIKDSKVVQLEALLLTFYWPEIQRKPELLDVLSTSNIALSLRDRVKKLASAWLLMHLLSLPVATRTSCLHPNSMPEGLFYRYVRMQLFLRTLQAKSLPKGRYMARHDVCGGSLSLWGDVKVLSALTGDCVLSCSIPYGLEDEESFLHLARTSAVEAFGLPYFAIDFLLSDQLIEEEATWQDLGCPSRVTMVKKPKVLDWADDLFHAIEKDDVDAVKGILKMGQDPNTTIINSALGTAVQQRYLPIVRMLVKAQANVNYVPPGKEGPLHSAVIHNAESCASFLLWEGANPNLEDNTAAKNTPLHYAAAYEDAAFADMLLARSANPFKQNTWYQSPYTLARCCGPVVSLCLEYSFHRVDAATLLQGILSILAEYGIPSNLWCTSKSFHSERPCWDVEGGSAVSFVLACTGEHICSLIVTEDSTVLDLKQHVARHHGHLPFAVSLVLEGKVVPMGAIWAVVGFPPPPVLDVVLNPRTNQYRLDLSCAVQEQQHDTIIAILSAGQEPNCSGIVRRTGRQEAVLLTAAGDGLFYCVHLLLSAFADPNVVGYDSRSALHLAVLGNSPMTTRLLLDCKADVSASDFGSETPLHYAALSENVLVVKQLLLAGADPLAPDAAKQIPLLCSRDAGTTACLMDGCWAKFSFVTLFLMNARMFSGYRISSKLSQLCRSLRHGFIQDVCGGSSDQARFSQLQSNKEAARARKMHRLVTWTHAGMQLPVRGDGAGALVPFNYEQFVPCQDITTLAWLHPHSRDRHVRFEAEKHEYFVHGVKTQGSVTGMIHAFARPFDADAVIFSMMNSDRWPRPNYLRPVLTDGVLKRVRQIDPDLLLALFDVPRNDPWICRRVQALQAKFPDLCRSLTLSPEEIKKMWEINGSQAATSGTYMHYLFEAYVNGYAVPQNSPEFSMLDKFLKGMEGWRAYRTEWVIFAEEEGIAGSIDLCAVDKEGALALIDWKRSANLQDKFSSPRAMLPPLSHMPDCAGSHYKLQLNAYRHIIEKYYGHKVSKMLIVGTHPDRMLQPFIYEVPRMEHEIDMIMKIWQRKAADACGGAAFSLDKGHGFSLTPSADLAVELEVCSAIIAELVLHCKLSRAEVKAASLAHIVRIAVSNTCGVSYFGIDILNGAGCLNDAATGEECGRPNLVFVIRKLCTFAWTDKLFAAIKQNELGCIRECLKEGQDTNCTSQENALTHAVIHSNLRAVELLLQAGASCDFIPEGQRHAASHLAAIQKSTDFLELLLLARAEPNLLDRAGMLPIHHATCVATAKQDQMVELLVRAGADMLEKDDDGDSAFSLAPSGRCVSACRDQCWHSLTMLDLLQRHIEDLAAFTPCSALWHTCMAMKKQAFFLPAHDVYGGALDSSQPSQGRALSQDPDGAELPEPEPAAQQEQQVKEEDAEEGLPDDLDDGNDPLLTSVKKRRLMKGAQTTRIEFDNMFRQFEEWNQALALEEKDVASSTDTILFRVDQLRQAVVAKYPRWSEHMIRLGAAATAASKVRLTDRLFIGDNAFFLWLVEGERHIRVHDGFCYIYNDNGAFLPYSGIPPQAVLVRLSVFFSQLEGIFRRMDPKTRRNDADILASIAADHARFTDEGSFLQACHEAAVWQQNALAPDHFDDADADADVEGPQGSKPSEEWTTSLGKRIWKICQSIRNELMHEKLVSLLVEWCETPRSQKPCVSYNDTCVQYDVNRETSLRHILKGADNDCYIFIPHPLLDPVLDQNTKRLQKFYQQTFWANNDVFNCNLAAMALAKRGFNIDRCFIGESPGGVGQSLFSMHIDAMLGSNHGYFDPNVWYNEDELRKQVESFARCIVVTGQEAPESHKRLHLDLFKKTMSGDGIAGRKPYGYTTRMFSVVGWKRLEVNRMMVFAGITKANFQSVMRRAFVWKPKARFHPESVLKQAHHDHEEDGHFLADPTLKNFVVSPGACAAGLRVQHAFELQHGQNDCVQMIEDYATGGDGYLTEDKMRKACGLELRVRHEETAMGGVGLLHVSDSQEERDLEERQYSELRDFLVKHLLDECLSDVTAWEFKKIYAQSSDRPNASFQTAIKELKGRNLVQKGCRKGKCRDVVQPVISCGVSFEEIIPARRADEGTIFPETMNIPQICNYLDGNPCRDNNVVVMKQFLAECLAEERRGRGRRAADDQMKKQTLQEQLTKLETYEKVCRELAETTFPSEPPAAHTPRRRSRCKQPELPQDPEDGLVAVFARYRYTGDRKLRARRYAIQNSAQKCARRIQTQLFGHTIDLDIENCCAALVLQLVDKLCPKPAMPEDVRQALQRWKDSRSRVCREELEVTDREGKKLVTAVLSGATPTKSQMDIPFVRNIHRASIYLRWLACSVLVEDYEELEKRNDKPYPGATTFFYMWSAVEDTILESWSNYLLSKRPTHLSLHFDGVRINADLVEDVESLLSACQDKIKEATGFNVQIRQKIHQHFLESLACLDVTALNNVPAELQKSPNCIPCALWHLAVAEDKEKLLQAFLQIDSQQNAFAAERKYRTYQQCTEVWDTVDLKPSTGMAWDRPGKYLLHTENNGCPHCVSAEIFKEADSLMAVVKDGSKQYKLEASSLFGLAVSSTDFSTMVSFCVSPREAEGTKSCLLELQAGSSPRAASSEYSTLFHQPNFIDSEFSSPRSFAGSSIPAFMLFPELVEKRISLFEGLCCDYIQLLASQPGLWAEIPSTFSALSQTEWITELSKARDLLVNVSSASAAEPLKDSALVTRVEKRLRVYISMLRNHCDTFHASDFLDEIPNPCDGEISKRTWESQVMLCRQKLRKFKQAHDVQGGRSDDEEEPAEAKFVIDDEGQAVFQDIIKDSLEEEIHAFMAEIAQDNIRKLHGSYKCPFCPFRAFKRLCQLSDHLRKHHVIAKQFVCSGTKQMKVILALHDADAAQRKAGADYLFRSALSLQTQIAPPLDQHKNCIDKDIRLLLQKDGPRYVNKNALGEQIHARRVLNIYYDKSFAEMIYREIVLHHSSVPWPHKWFWRSGPFAKRGRGEGYIYIYICG